MFATFSAGVSRLVRSPPSPISPIFVITLLLHKFNAFFCQLCRLPPPERAHPSSSSPPFCSLTCLPNITLTLSPISIQLTPHLNYTPLPLYLLTHPLTTTPLTQTSTLHLTSTSSPFLPTLRSQHTTHLLPH